MRTRNGLTWKEASALATKKRKKEKEVRINEYNLNPSLCKNCNKSFLYEKRKNKFCDRSCSASFNNLGVIRNITNGVWSKKPCLYCGNETGNRKFCNRACEHEYIKQQKREKIVKEGRVFDKKDKWYLIETRTHTCEKCNNSKWNGQNIPLDMHHKDGDSDNNQLDNLLLICPNCHRQTHNHGSKNKKTGKSKRQQYRKNRYDKGLSY